MTRDECIESAIQAFLRNKHDFELFQDAVVNFFCKHPSVVPQIHSVRSRLKDLYYLRKKLGRNWDKTGPIHEGNVFKRKSRIWREFGFCISIKSSFNQSTGRSIRK